MNIESKLRLLWFCIPSLCDWTAKLAPLSQPMRKKPKTNRDLHARIFQRFVPVTCKNIAFTSDWLIASSSSDASSWSNCFGLGCTKNALIKEIAINFGTVLCKTVIILLVMNI